MAQALQDICDAGMPSDWVEYGPTLAHIGRMADDWNEKLRCPSCGKTGMASLSQGAGDATPTIHRVPDGFKVVQTQYGPDFHCGTCNIAVDP